MVVLPGSLYTFAQTYGPWPPRSRAWCPCTPMWYAPKKTLISWSAAFKPVRWRFWRFWLHRLWRPILEQICTWLSLQTDYAIRPSWTPIFRGVNNCRNSSAKSGRLIGCAPGHRVTPPLCALFHAGASGDSLPLHAFPTQGHQVTPRLCVIFPAGASGDSSPSCAFPCRAIKWLLTFACFSAQGDEVTPLHREGPYHLEWVRERSPLHTAAADVGLVSCECECILYPRLPLM